MSDDMPSKECDDDDEDGDDFDVAGGFDQKYVSPTSLNHMPDQNIGFLLASSALTHVTLRHRSPHLDLSTQAHV